MLYILCSLTEVNIVTFDSFVIADCLRFGRINKELYIGDYRYKALQNLTRARYFAVSNLIKEKQRFMNILFKKYSTMTQEKVFSDTFSTTALAVYDEKENILFCPTIPYLFFEKITSLCCFILSPTNSYLSFRHHSTIFI
ncbi:MAG: hypothetical protein J6D26_05170 [Clostridia bacterium]|nr:hypothetical protein [Clostridia bacterium]